MPGFAPLAAVPLASAGVPPAREALSAWVFTLGALAQGRSQARAVAQGAVVLAGKAQGKIFAQARALAANDTGVLTLVGQSRGAALQDAQVDAAVSLFGKARTVADTAAVSVTGISVDGDASSELADAGQVTGDYGAAGQAAGEAYTTVTVAVAIAINLDCAVSPSNTAHAAGALPFTARQGAGAAITAHAAVRWQAARHGQFAITAVEGDATRLLSLDSAARGFAEARSTGADSIALTGTAHLAGTANLRAQGRIALAGRGNTRLSAQAILAHTLRLTGQGSAAAQEDRFATSASNTRLSGNATALAGLIGQTSGHITLRVETTSNTAVLGRGQSRVDVARKFDAAATVDAGMARAIIFAGASAAITAGATRETITALLLLSGHARVQVGTDVAAATAVPIGIACAGRVGLSIGASQRVFLPFTLTGTIGLSGTATKAVVLAGIASAALHTIAQIARTPLALTGTAQATLSITGKSDGRLALTRRSRTSALIDASTVPALHLQLQAAAIVPLHGLGLTALALQGKVRLPGRVAAIGRGRLDLVGAGKSAVAMRATAGAGFEPAAVAGAKVAAGGRASDRFTVTRMGAGDIAVRGDAARLITFKGQSVLRVSSRAFAQPALAPNLRAAGVSGLQGKLSAQAIRPDGTCLGSMSVDAAGRHGSWLLALRVLGVRAPPGQRRFTPPDTAQGGSVITAPRSGVLRAEPRTGRIRKG